MTNKISIGFTGDFSFSGYFKGCHKDEKLLDRGILEFLNKNDANVINFESPITPCRMTKKKRLAHRCAPEVLDYVQSHFKNPILSLANNHMMDYGRTGMMDTLEVLLERKIPYIGAGSTVEEAAKYQIIGDEIKIGVFAIQYKNYRIAGERCAGPLHDKRKQYIEKTISALKEKVDYVVLVYHGGDEFLHAPMPYFRKHLRKYLNMGCDIVVAHHPHVVSGYETFGKKMIFYSLGNFMFDTEYQRAMEDTDRGVLLNLSFTGEGYEFESLSIKIDRENHRVHVAERDPYFDDVKTKYSRLWALEAARWKTIVANAAKLKERELEEGEKEKIEAAEKLEALLKKYEIAEEKLLEDEEEEEARREAEGDSGASKEPDEDVVKKENQSLYKTIRKGLRQIFNVKKYEQAVIGLGSLKAKFFYGR